jgi:hypothetical protein
MPSAVILLQHRLTVRSLATAALVNIIDQLRAALVCASSVRSTRGSRVGLDPGRARAGRVRGSLAENLAMPIHD